MFVAREQDRPDVSRHRARWRAYQGRIDPSPLVTEVAAFDRFGAAFEGLRKGPDSCKLLLKPN